jgi:pimeloyl-ACP methyl ester carboxylesterase
VVVFGCAFWTTVALLTAITWVLSRIRCPTVVTAGDADGIVNVDRQARRLHGAIPGSRQDVLAGAGHMIHHVDPARIVKAIDLIATGGITQASMEAEAASWGTPA